MKCKIHKRKWFDTKIEKEKENEKNLSPLHISYGLHSLAHQSSKPFPSDF